VVGTIQVKRRIHAGLGRAVDGLNGAGATIKVIIFQNLFGLVIVGDVAAVRRIQLERWVEAGMSITVESNGRNQVPRFLNIYFKFPFCSSK